MDPKDMPTARSIAFIAGPKSHGPEGNGIHDYAWDARVAAAMLLRSNVGASLRVQIHEDGWPEDDAELDQADVLVLLCDGRDGDAFAEALHLQSLARMRRVAGLMSRGCGLVVLHFGTFAPQSHAAQVLDWCGGYFRWQSDDGQRLWSSAITTTEAEVVPCAPGHPVLQGVGAFRVREEFYHRIAFPLRDPRWSPLLRVPELGGRDGHGDVVAWARERSDGGRGFGATLGHFHDNWRVDAYRTVLLNGICWAARLEIPVAGVQAPIMDREMASAVLRRSEPSEAMRFLLLAGNGAHRWHNWERSTPAIVAALLRDARCRVEVIQDPEDLRRRKLGGFAGIILNYCNWEDPIGLSAAAKAALLGYVRSGGGLIVLHFANGAFHHSLPQAGASDWPDYRRMVLRVWDHDAAADGPSAHDEFRSFAATPTGDHAIVAGIDPFMVEDELYVRQRGDAPIIPLLTAASHVTGRVEPLAWTARFGRGRIFQTLLGHSERTYEAFGAREMLRRAAAWVARRTLQPLAAAEDIHRPLAPVSVEQP